MSGSTVHLVWFKKDLRLADHKPLTEALTHASESTNPVQLGLVYLIEPTLLVQPDSAPQHFEFAMECLQDLASQLPVHVGIQLICADAVDFFKSVVVSLQAGQQLHVHSHEETGNWASFERDKQVGRILKDAGALWHQHQSNAVVRNLKDRDVWSQLWLREMQKPALPIPSQLLVEKPAFQNWRLKENSPFKSVLWRADDQTRPEWSTYTHFFTADQSDKANRQRGGRAEALRTLQGFFDSRGRRYRFEMSSPLSAESACSRVSPYLAFGVLSIREVLKLLDQNRKDDTQWKASLKSFESRLHWHCHFIQKLETEPELEFRAAHPALNDLRNSGPLSSEEADRLSAWIEGRTGFPMIDACMRMLRNTGWVNFRMRAMLVAFASYQLWLDWRHTAPLLAREFLDYEPGIHYAQFQMQSGVTGINTLRIYNPVKQAKDHDPEGTFIKRWVPELANCPVEWLANPWDLPGLIQQDTGCIVGEVYPAPIVNPDTAISVARQNMTAWRKSPQFAQLARAVYIKHGSRNPNRNGTPKPRKRAKAKAEADLSANLPEQGSLFD